MQCAGPGHEVMEMIKRWKVTASGTLNTKTHTSVLTNVLFPILMRDTCILFYLIPLGDLYAKYANILIYVSLHNVHGKGNWHRSSWKTRTGQIQCHGTGWLRDAKSRDVCGYVIDQFFPEHFGFTIIRAKRLIFIPICFRLSSIAVCCYMWKELAIFITNDMA